MLSFLLFPENIFNSWCQFKCKRLELRWCLLQDTCVSFMHIWWMCPAADASDRFRLQGVGELCSALVLGFRPWVVRITVLALQRANQLLLPCTRAPACVLSAGYGKDELLHAPSFFSAALQSWACHQSEFSSADEGMLPLSALAKEIPCFQGRPLSSFNLPSTTVVLTGCWSVS